MLDLAYGSALLGSSPFLLYKLATSERYREGFTQRLGKVPPRPVRGPCLWVHAASVGEVQAARPLIRECQVRWPHLEIAVSTQTLTGQQIVRTHLPECHLFYYPIDLSSIVCQVLDRIRPSCVVLVEREVWPNLIAAASRRRIPVVQVNSRISEASLKAYRWLYPVLGPALQSIRHFVTQSEEYAERLRSLAIPSERVAVSGNLKYDGVPTSIPDAEQEQLRAETGVDDGAPVLVCGSVHPPEIETLVRAYQSVRERVPAIRLILVPRHMERMPEIERIISEADEAGIRRTELRKQPDAGPASKGKVVVVDTMGELRAFYALATVVFVGGSLTPVGGHNVIEPAALGKPVVFGPHTFDQAADAEALLAASAAYQGSDSEEVAKYVNSLFNDPAQREAMGQRASEVLHAHQGATQKTVDVLSRYLPLRVNTDEQE